MRYAVRTSGQLGPILRAFRKKMGLSQAELGRKISLSQERISAIESKPEKVTFDQLLTVLMSLDAEFVIAPRKESEISPVRQGEDGPEIAPW